MSLLDKGWSDVNVNFNDAVGMANVAKGYFSEIGNILDRYQNRQIQQEKNDIDKLRLAEAIRQFGITNQFNRDQLAYMKENAASDRLDREIQSKKDLKNLEFNREDANIKKRADALRDYYGNIFNGSEYARISDEMNNAVNSHPE